MGGYETLTLTRARERAPGIGGGDDSAVEGTAHPSALPTLMSPETTPADVISLIASPTDMSS